MTRAGARLRPRAAILGALLAITACHDRARSSPPGDAAAPPEPHAAEPHAAELAGLAAFEDELRRTTEFATQPPAEAVLGPDPYRLAALPGDTRLVGILRGDAALVLIDHDGAELDRVAAPRAPSGLAVTADRQILVVGDSARVIARYQLAGDRLRPDDRLAVDALGLRDIALAPDGATAYVAEEQAGRVLAIGLPGAAAAPRAGPPRELGRCHGPIQLVTAPGAVAAACVLDHSVEIWRDAGPHAQIRHDGPIWSVAIARAADGALLIAAGGVEDHPLEREDGGFGYIDSYLYLYRLAPGAAPPVRLAAINASALGVVTPKWLALDLDAAGAVTLTTAGYATPALVRLRWPAGGLTAQPTIERTDLLPGTTAAQRTADGRIIAADPLLDSWVVAHDGEVRARSIASAQPARSTRSRIGELLFFTELMAPWNRSDGKLSRFTCETCHHEGYVDGRTHFTGRGEVFATTRPLRGLVNNRPYFSRALDRTMAQMVHAEFRVANRHNGRDPWFALSAADVGWLGQVPGLPTRLSPALLRESLIAFFLDFTHRANPAAIDHSRFTARERAGASVFRARCAACHAARLVADRPETEVGFAGWEALVLSPAGPIVWSNAAYAKTGVVPYVHAEGARVPTLRRLAKKWPYFTSGRARSLGELLARFAWGPGVTYHDAAPADPALGRLTDDDRAALAAFLALL